MEMKLQGRIEDNEWGSKWGEHSSKNGSHLDLSFRQYAASLPVFIQVPNNSFILHTIIQKLRELNDAILISINFINLHPYSCLSSQAFHILAQTNTSRDHGRDGWVRWMRESELMGRNPKLDVKPHDHESSA